MHLITAVRATLVVAHVAHALTETRATIADIRTHGDLLGHIRALVQTLRGDDTTTTLTLPTPGTAQRAPQLAANNVPARERDLVVL